jgi:hypothetical protein
VAGRGGVFGYRTIDRTPITLFSYGKKKICVGFTTKPAPGERETHIGTGMFEERLCVCLLIVHLLLEDSYFSNLRCASIVAPPPRTTP